MTERNDWQRVKPLLAQALELTPSRRSQFIEACCDEDPLLRRELKSLVRNAVLAEDFLESSLKDAPPGDKTARPASPAPNRSQSFEIGQMLGQYRLEAKIGEGGMGTVFKARDTRLGRDVAVKTVLLDGIPEASRQGLLDRFQREMHILASLDHQNVLRIYDSGEEAGIPYAVMELLEGRTLADTLDAGPLSVRRAIDIAVEVARGLAAAHRAGIVHRDLKPANLFLTQDSTVKILDFGIAKPIAGGAGALTWEVTSRGLVLGTPCYMAPEQACGEDCDHRADLFACGAILYEMISGRRAFDGQSFLEIQHQVIREDPPPLLSLRPDVGAPLVRLVERCLEKDPADRVPSAEILGYMLQDLRETTAAFHLPTGETSGQAGSVPSRRWLPLALTALAASLITALIPVAGLWWAPSPAPESAPPEPVKLEQLTQYTRDSSPDVSRDGRLLAYLSERGGQSQIRLRQLGSGVERMLTTGQGRPVFDRDGEWVLFSRQSATPDGTPRQQLYRVNVLQPRPQPYFEDASIGAWSPDGTYLAFVRETWGGSINQWQLGIAETAAIESGEVENVRIVHTAHAPIPHLRWSPDSRFLYAVIENSAQGTRDELLRVDITRDFLAVLDLQLPAGRLSRPALNGSGSALYIAHAESLSGHLQTSRILRYSLAEALVLQEEAEGDRAEAAGDLKDIPAYRFQRPGRTELWVPARVHHLERQSDRALAIDHVLVSQQLLEIDLGDPSRQRWLTEGRSIDRQPVYAGKDVIFTSNRSGNLELWRWSRERESAEPIFPHPADDWDPATSVDGKTLLWSTNRGGQLEIYAGDLDSRRSQPFTKGRAPAENPSLSVSKRWVVYSSGHDDYSGLRRMRFDGSEDQAIPTELGRAHPEISPDGRYVLFHDHLIDGQTRVFVVEAATGVSTAFIATVRVGAMRIDPGITLGRARWRPDGGAIGFLGVGEGGTPVVFEQAFDPVRATDATRRVLFRPPLDKTPESFAYSPDGRRMVLSLMERESSILLATFSSLD